VDTTLKLAQRARTKGKIKGIKKKKRRSADAAAAIEEVIGWFKVSNFAAATATAACKVRKKLYSLPRKFSPGRLAAGKEEEK
jgi:hypothetical protein